MATELGIMSVDNTFAASFELMSHHQNLVSVSLFKGVTLIDVYANYQN